MPLNTCATAISKAITSNCTTQPEGQIEQRAWIFQRGEQSISYKTGTTNIIDEIVNNATKKSYKILGVKTLLNAGMEEVIAADRATRFKHKFNFQQFEFAAADILNVDFLDDIFVVVERKDKPTDGDGTFIAYGVKNGLWKASGTRMSNETNGVRIVEMASMDEGLEPHSEYTVTAVPVGGESVYAATLAMLTATETAPV